MTIVYSCKTKGGTASIVQGQSNWHIRLGALRLDGVHATAETAALALAGRQVRLPVTLDARDWVVPSGLASWTRHDVANDSQDSSQ